MKIRKVQKILLLVLILLAFLGPMLSPYSYELQDVTIRNAGASWLHWFGTDKFGRDLFTRVCCGMRLSLLTGGISAVICGGIGSLIGGMAGYMGGKTDTILTELMNILSAIPSLLYVILIQLVFDSGMSSVILGFCVAGWIDLAKVFRAETIRQKQMEYCMAARMMGFSSIHILGRYILPNVKSLWKPQVFLIIPKAIFTEAFLSFLGIGIAAPQASLGTLIQDAKSQITLYPMQMVYPVVMLVLIFLALQGVTEKTGAMEQQRM